MAERDFQVSKVYRAEEIVNGRPEPWIAWGRLDSVWQIQGFVDEIMDSEWVQSFGEKYNDMLNVTDVRVTDGRGRRRPGVSVDGYTAFKVKMPRFSRCVLLILHEIAHVLTPLEYSHHGREFCATYLQLTKRWVGKKERDELKAAFDICGVKYKRRPKHELKKVRGNRR